MDIDNGRYRLVRRVGSGGTGVVYQAADRLLGRRVAVKALHPSLSASLLEREAQALAQIAHPDIVTIHDVVEDEGNTFLIMEYVDGRSLQRWLTDHGPMARDQALAVFRRIAGAVQYAHTQGVLHCDLKPANILLSTHGDVKLTDFTLARVLEGDSFHGPAGASAAYAAPEQLEGGTIDARTDVFGLGALLFQMVASIVPDSEDGRRIVQVVERATAAEPDDRYPTVEAMLQDLPATEGSVTLVVGQSVTSDLTRVAPLSTTRHRPLIQTQTSARWPLMLIPAALVIAVAGLFMGFHALAAPETVAVPNLIRVARAPAGQVVRSLALHPRVVWSYSTAVPAGSVIAQRPRAESRVQKGTTVTLVVSEGPRPVPVPSLDGLSQDQATAALHHLGFRVTVKTYETVFQHPGNVLVQSPDAGTLRVPGSAIVITVSVRPWWFPLP